MARHLERQVVELHVRVSGLDGSTRLGGPETVRVAKLRHGPDQPTFPFRIRRKRTAAAVAATGSQPLG